MTYSNINGGGLSVEVSGKYTSIRHELAREAGKLTAGEVAKKISNAVKIKVSAKEVVEAYRLIKGCEPEWHHAGFYRNSRGKSTMGRTFFFKEHDVDELTARWIDLRSIEQKIQDDAQRERDARARKEIVLNDYRERCGAIYFSRITTRPMYSVTITREMKGKYGWFEANDKYNLPIYYSGYQFKTEEDLNGYYELCDKDSSEF